MPPYPEFIKPELSPKLRKHHKADWKLIKLILPKTGKISRIKLSLRLHKTNKSKK